MTEQKKINYIFSIGFNCISSDFLQTYKYRKMSSPFDYMYIDFESALKVINNNFIDYLKDIVAFAKPKKRLILYEKKNSEEIRQEFKDIMDYDAPIMCNTENYNDETMFFNQNYMDTGNNKMNLYEWRSICMFFHHNMLLKSSFETLERRCNRMQNIMNSSPSLLFYVSKSTELNIPDDIFIEFHKYTILIEKYGLQNQNFVIIIPTNPAGNFNILYEKIGNCLFIIKTNGIDIGDSENNVIKHFFDLELLEKP